MFRRYLREIEVAGVLLLIVGFVIACLVGYDYGAWPCAFGLLLLLVTFLYKAFHWKEYERENKQYIVIILVAIALQYLQLMLRR